MLLLISRINVALAAFIDRLKEHKNTLDGISSAAKCSTPSKTRRLPARIAALQKDTEAVSALLSGIFKEESPPEPVFAEPEPEGDVEPTPPGLIGLDEAHSALARLLLSRPEWTKDELGDAAADLDLMLDGALEQINEAAFDAFDEPLFEGEDPISVNTKLLEKIEA